MNEKSPHPVRQWRSLEERAATPEFREWLEREFPPLASEWHDGLSRRSFLKMMGASFALAGLGACTRQPREKIVPYVSQPERVIPGRPLTFATAMPLGGNAHGLLVESHEGRPTKIEGNPAHPATLGASDVFLQASVLDLYDPARSKAPTHRGEIAPWPAFQQAMLEQTQRDPTGAGLRILTGRTTSSTLIDQIDTLRQRMPGLRWHHFEPLDASTIERGPSDPVHDLSVAEVIVAVDADPFGEGPARLVNIRQWANRRSRMDRSRPRLYVAEPAPTITGARADFRRILRGSAVAGLLRQLQEGRADDEWSRHLLADLERHQGSCLFIAGRSPADEVRALTDMLNARYGRSAGKKPAQSGSPDSLAELAAAMRAGEVQTLLVLGTNPVATAPSDLMFGEALGRVGFSAHLGLMADATAQACQWHLPEAHYLESWSDCLAFDGTPSLVQPLIEPLYGGWTAHELLALLTGTINSSSHKIVRAFWRKTAGVTDFEEFWRRSLASGVVDFRFNDAAEETTRREPQSSRAGELEINFRMDPALYDGRFGNNGWLRELAAPLTKVCWGNVVQISPATAARLGLSTGDMVTLERAGRSVDGPVFIQPGHADEAVTVTLGHGHPAGGSNAGYGFDAYPLRTTDALWTGFVSLRRSKGKQEIVTTQHHQTMDGREFVRVVNSADEKPDTEPPQKEETLYHPDEFLQGDLQWGMAIDLNACVGCNACIIACQAENNIPVVGPGQVAMGREMAWIRLDRYFEGTESAPEIHFQPVPCMHCENAPCELVCPVGATLHDSEGLNVQIYNRCIGTRYCSNNCPYKVRRFNFLEYNGDVSSSERLQKNPDVTVRVRGVMEKCTYCVQRISAARIEVKKEFRAIRDGEVIPACAQACPAEAITFGNVADPQSRVSRKKRSPLNYGLLAELNTRPRTTYLAKVRIE